MVFGIFVIAALLVIGGFGGLISALNLIPTDLGLAHFQAGILSLVAGLVVLAIGFATRAVVVALRRVATPRPLQAPLETAAELGLPAAIDPALEVPMRGGREIAIGAGALAAGAAAGATVAAAAASGEATGRDVSGASLEAFEKELLAEAAAGLAEPASKPVPESAAVPAASESAPADIPILDRKPAGMGPAVEPDPAPLAPAEPDLFAETLPPLLPQLDILPPDLPEPLALDDFAPAPEAAEAVADAGAPVAAVAEPAPLPPPAPLDFAEPAAANPERAPAPELAPMPELTPMPGPRDLRLEPIPEPPVLSIEQEIRAQLGRIMTPEAFPRAADPLPAPPTPAPPPPAPIAVPSPVEAEPVPPSSGLIADADLAALDTAAPPLAPLETLDVVGAYDSAGTRYTMYSDGSVVASGPEGVTRYPTLQDLRRYLDQLAG